MVDDEYIDFANISDIDFGFGGLNFRLPSPFKPEIYGQCPNIALILIDISDQSKNVTLGGNLTMIAALRDAFIHNIHCTMQLRFTYAQLPPPQYTTNQPSLYSIANHWDVIGVQYRRQ